MSDFFNIERAKLLNSAAPGLVQNYFINSAALQPSLGRTGKLLDAPIKFKSSLGSFYNSSKLRKGSSALGLFSHHGANFSSLRAARSYWEVALLGTCIMGGAVLGARLSRNKIDGALFGSAFGVVAATVAIDRMDRLSA